MIDDKITFQDFKKIAPEIIKLVDKFQNDPNEAIRFFSYIGSEIINKTKIHLINQTENYMKEKIKDKTVPKEIVESVESLLKFLNENNKVK